MGMPEKATAGPAGFISPHLDDVVMSCSGAITAGSVVVTVFASGPNPVSSLPSWDIRCGFSPGDDVSAVRRREDHEALATFAAHCKHLDFWANQYRASPPRFPRAKHWTRKLLREREEVLNRQLVDRVASELASVFDGTRLDTWFAPLGVGHPDHRITSAAVLRLARANPGRRWIFYEDLPYARQEAGLRRAALRRVADAGFSLEQPSWIPDVNIVAKRAAIECYRSQLTALGPSVEISVRGPETYHVLSATG